MNSNEIRKQYLQFFKDKGHTVVNSAPVIPFDDPTLLFINAGMNQYKDIFLGKRTPENNRVANSQKCIRAGGKHNDLDEVGRDGYHHTFFEMLGNWSFGDYYKKEAIRWAWELLTEVWKLPKVKLYATVHKSDKEAYELWKTETDIDQNHIEYHDDKDNFWEMGNIGPCGPCSEIHIDRGEEFCNLKSDEDHECKVNGGCHRFIELWNLVFIQFLRDEKGKLHQLKDKFVDTGAGFERLCQVLQNKKSNYDTDLFQPLIKKIEQFSLEKYHSNQQGTSHRVIADHIRALAFAIADGGMPSNEGRGYVLRRILRRAARHGRLLSVKKPFLYKLVDDLVKIMGESFPELKEKKTLIKMIIKAEEERFNETLDKGLAKFSEILLNLKGNQIPGDVAFMLYDTYGFPLDLTMIMAEERNLGVDEKGFEKEMEKQRKRARDAAKFDLKNDDVEWKVFRPIVPTEFIGYTENEANCKILKFHLDKKKNVKIVLDKTPFYAESGGQMSDTGTIYNKECQIFITDVQKDADIFIHLGKLNKGEITSEAFTAEIDIDRRMDIARNHTVTHLLHKALKEVLGDHIQQKGSYLHPDHLRFDFTHYQQVSKHQLDIIERIINKKIRECLPVKTEVKKIQEAKKEGAVALFGEKYGENVRVITIGNYSKELCGGTHLDYTGEIGLFKVISESSIAAGIRRLEAVTGMKAERYVKILEDNIAEIGRVLNAPASAVIEKINKLITENKEFSQQLKQSRLKATGNSLDEIINTAVDLEGVKLVVAEIELQNPGMMRQIGDQLKDKLKSGIGVLFAEVDQKVSILTIVTKDLTKKYQAGKIIGKIAEIVDGKGGGRSDMAMAGGKDASKIKDAVKKVPEIISSMKQN
ncbi:MAG: alanine--tRNA ligase [Candidatus Cloacimonetes bacterium]|nr:alanine--tRNA ligase [Candidatus Cloacimonadota bacterium]